MDVSIHQMVLLVLAALIPVAAYVVTTAELLTAVAAVNVVLIWLSLHIATGGRPQPETQTNA